MRGYDLAIVGDGLAPCLVSMAMAALHPNVSITQLSTDTEIGGDQLDLVLADRLVPLLAGLIAPAVTLEWPLCLSRANQQTSFIEERVWLVDPIQIWLELSGRISGDALHAGCQGLTIRDGGVDWDTGSVAADRVIDLRALGTIRRQSEIVEAAVFAELPCPVLADFDGGAGHWLYLQYAPLGSGRALINRIGDATEAPGNRAATMPVDALPTVAAMTRIGELCAAFRPA